jgi:transcriptional regulator with XRE-family HTH domain
MAECEKLKNIIAEIKFKRGLRQADIAGALGIKPTYLSDMINGRVPFSDAIKNKLSELFSDCSKANAQVACGDENILISGNDNQLIDDSGALSRAFDEIKSHRRLLERTITMLEKKDEQLDRMIGLLEHNNK